MVGAEIRHSGSPFGIHRQSIVVLNSDPRTDFSIRTSYTWKILIVYRLDAKLHWADAHKISRKASVSFTTGINTRWKVETKPWDFMQEIHVSIQTSRQFNQFNLFF